MQEMRDNGATYEQIAAAFGHCSGGDARAALLSWQRSGRMTPPGPKHLTPAERLKKAKVMLAMYEAGSSWSEVAERHGYLTGGGARKFVRAQFRR